MRREEKRRAVTADRSSERPDTILLDEGIFLSSRGGGHFLAGDRPLQRRRRRELDSSVCRYTCSLLPKPRRALVLLILILFLILVFILVLIVVHFPSNEDGGVVGGRDEGVKFDGLDFKEKSGDDNESPLRLLREDQCARFD